jgi:hypothetical protein
MDPQDRIHDQHKHVQKEIEAIWDVIVIGGGAAGVFAALAVKEQEPNAHVLILEKSQNLLSKVRISGGGRCNVTHSCFDPKILVQNYPRGSKELLGPFHYFQPKDTVEWFTSRGVPLKTESDGRIFPCSDSSSSIIDCLLKEARKLHVVIHTKQTVERIEKGPDFFSISYTTGETVRSKHLLLATGSHPQGFEWAKSFGHTIQDPIPSLFTVTIPGFALKDLAGISVEKASASLAESSLTQTGPLLITHWGFSGPAILKLSAWGARTFHERKYQTDVFIDWLPDLSKDQILEILQTLRKNSPHQTIGAKNPFDLPKNLWKRLLELSEIDGSKRCSDISNENHSKLGKRLKADRYSVGGKSTHKEEFVTCGGVLLAEIDSKTMESRLCKGLFFAGEILNVDAVTGGFNFQNAWTTGWLAGHAMAKKDES